MATTTSMKAAEAKLVRGPDGRVLFMEVDSEFADILLAVLHAPIGAILQAVATDNDDWEDTGIALGGLATSATQLRPGILNVKSEDVLPKEFVVSRMLTYKHRRKEKPLHCVGCVKAYGAQEAQYRDKHAPGLCGHCQKPTDRLCPQLNIGDCCQGRWLKNSAGVHCVYCFTTCSVTEKSKMAASRTCEQCKYVTRTCEQCNLCDECAVYTCGYVLKGLTDTVAKGGPTCKDTVTFLVTNQLEVFENSFVKGLEIMGKANITDFKGLTYQAIQLKVDDIRSMLHRALCGSRRILDETFPSVERDVAEDDVQSSVHTNTTGSFNLVINDSGACD